MIELKDTSDGSHTLYSTDFQEHYHSINGAINESTHVFINAGIKTCNKTHINIFEVGFGTGLNTLLTYIYALQNNLTINYHAIELYPIDHKILEKLNYSEIINPDFKNTFENIHKSPWNNNSMINSNFYLTKIQADFCKYELRDNVDLVYFDAFSPETQPELWSLENFHKIYSALNPGGFLVTYSSKGLVKQNLRNAGFDVKRLKGPVGKHHMIRATKY